MIDYPAPLFSDFLDSEVFPGIVNSPDTSKTSRIDHRTPSNMLRPMPASPVAPADDYETGPRFPRFAGLRGHGVNRLFALSSEKARFDQVLEDERFPGWEIKESNENVLTRDSRADVSGSDCGLSGSEVTRLAGNEVTRLAGFPVKEV